MRDRPPSTARLVRESRQRTTVTAVGVTVAALVTFLSAMILLPETGNPADVPPGPSGGPSDLAGGLHLRDDFAALTLDERWTPFTFGAPTVATIRPGVPGLALAVDTRRSGGHPRHGAGVLSAPLDVGTALSIRVVLDWRPPPNACYRAAGLVVLPDAGGALASPFDPAQLPTSACLEVVGVPPGERARRHASVRTGVHPRSVFTDGWPASRAGRVVGRTELEVLVDERGVLFSADGQTLGRGSVPFGPRVRLLLFTASNANYPPRPVVFEEVQLLRQGVSAAVAATPRKP